MGQTLMMPKKKLNAPLAREEYAMKKYLACVALLLFACSSSGPQKALDEVAKAMDDNNSQAFLAHVDMDAWANNYIKSLTENDAALSSINDLTKMFGLGKLSDITKMFGLGNLDDLINSVVDIKAKLSNEFNRGVASGELMAQCRASTSPDCPWVPESLREAKIIEIGADAAIAKVTTPARLTSWLALRKINNVWLIVGQAVLENNARAMATAQSAPSGDAGQQKDARRI